MKAFRRMLRWGFVLLLVAGYLACAAASCLDEKGRPRFEVRVFLR
jgi:hypothetical protein